MSWWMMVALSGQAMAGKENPPLVWTGIDYGLVRCVGTLDFNDPAAIFPGYLDKWNGLFIAEYVDNLQARTRVSSVRPVIGHLHALHAAADPNTQIIRDDSFSIDRMLPEEVVRERVKSYTLDETEGTALVLIADQLNKPAQKGCFWVVNYDIATRDVMAATRTCSPAGGIGFRNYWFGAVKDVIDRLPRK
jgi:hypothetical protein